jgi:hypothetical protein
VSFGGLGEAMDDVELTNEITLAIVYVDDHLLELEAVVRAGHWCGRANAYTVPQDVATFADALHRFADGATPQAEFTAGADNGIGLLAMRFYRVDREGHVACNVRLATGRLPTDHRPEEVWRLSIEVEAESWAVLKFAQQLGEIARTRAGRASLQV